MTKKTQDLKIESGELLLQLDWDIEPERDLWPDISSNIKFAKRRSNKQASWAPAAIAACLVLSVVSVIFSFDSYRLSQQNEQLQASLIEFQQSQIQLIEQQHQFVRAQFSTMLLQRDQLDPMFVSELQNIMATIDQASIEIKTAMKAQPNNPNLASMLMKTYQNETTLLNRIHTSKSISI